MPRTGRPRITEHRMKLSLSLPPEVAAAILAELARVRHDVPGASAAAVCVGLVVDGLRARERARG